MVVMAHLDGHGGQTDLGVRGLRGYQRAMARHPIRILGIDPGLRRTGWGLIESDGNRLIHI
ncbi:MAG: crossover junction endodeoxyribonuclease RuvC, partial [Pseudolabrys sp.]